MKRVLVGVGTVLGIALVAIQLLPAPSHANPPVVREPAWDSPRTRELAARACFDCHSNETKWPWYSNVAPISWVVGNHVEEGRTKLNFSTWDNPGEDAHEAAEVVEEGEMPLWDYVLMHPEAKLTAAEKADLIAGLRATVEKNPIGEGGSRTPGLWQAGDDD